MAARNIFQNSPRRRQVLGDEYIPAIDPFSSGGSGSSMSYGPDRSEAGETDWLPPGATVNGNGTVTIPKQWVNPNGTPLPGEKVNPDGSITIPDPALPKPATVVGPSAPAAPVTPPAAPVAKKADMSAYLIPLALLGATALGGYMLLRKRGRR